MSPWLSLRSLFSFSRWAREPRPRPYRKVAETTVLGVEQLEDRWVPAVLVPTTFSDGIGIGSLRDAILTSDSNGQSNTIDLSAGTYNLSLAGRGNLAGTTGALEVNDAGFTVNIQGAGAGQTFINANAIDRVFQVFGNVTVNFMNLTISGGFAIDSGNVGGPSALGGGILNDGGNVNLNAVTISGNTAVGTPGQDALGGGIYSQGGSLNIESSIITNNERCRGPEWWIGRSGCPRR
jgi:hypothetical protein